MSATARPSWKPQFTLRLMLFLCVVFGLLFAYAGSYYRLSRRGMREATEYDMEGFFYAPSDDIFATHDMTQHFRLMIFYAPANWIDQTLFNAPGPSAEPMWGLSP